MITKSALRKGLELPICRVGLNLGVPHLGIKPREPIAKVLQLFDTEAFHLSLYALDSTHLKLHSQITPNRDPTGLAMPQTPQQ